jgi:hypothetical protein
MFFEKTGNNLSLGEARFSGLKWVFVAPLKEAV